MTSASSPSEIVRPYVPRLLVDWMGQEAGLAHRRIDGTLVFADISGFTALTERLAGAGKAGAEEMAQLLNATFEQLLTDAYDYGAALVKWGGDATLLLYSGQNHAARACRSAWLMQRTIRRIGRLRTSAGSAILRMSIGIHTGALDFFLVGSHHRELIVTGPGAGAVALMEELAEATEIVLSPETLAHLKPEQYVPLESGEEPGAARLTSSPVVATDPAPEVMATADLSLALPLRVREHVLAGGVEPEHRLVATSFVQFSGSDRYLAEDRAPALTEELHELVEMAAVTAANYGVSFLATDLARDGGKLMLTAGAPATLGDSEERLLCVTRRIVDHPSALRLRDGVTRGAVFSGDFGPSYRRTYSVIGDTVNLAARLMARAEWGEVITTPEVLEHSTATFPIRPLEPFMVKGKSRPIDGCVVTGLPEAADRASSSAELPFTGRSTDLTALLGAFQEARSGSGTVVEIVGPVGLGKSRLVREALSAVDVPVHLSCCHPHQSVHPYLALRPIARGLLNIPHDAGPDEAGALLTRTVVERCPDILPWIGLTGTVFAATVESGPAVMALDERFQQRKLTEVLVTLLAAMAENPVVLVVEDLHFADSASLDILAELAVIGRRRPWLILTTRRPEGRSLISEEMDHGSSLWLTPLPDTDAMRLLEAATENEPLPTHVIAEVRERAGGNPLYLQKLAAVYHQLGDEDQLPDTVEAVVAVEIDQLPPRARRLVRTLSVLGTTAPRSRVTRYLKTIGESFPGAVWRQAADLIDANRTDISFRHALVREVAYQSLPYARRRGLHRAAAEVIGELGEADLQTMASLSSHLYAAGDFETALSHSVRAAELARAGYAPVETVRLYERAVSSAEKMAGRRHPQLGELTTTLADARFRIGAFEAARAALRVAHSVISDPVRSADLKGSIADTYSETGDFRRALIWLSRGMAQVRAGSDDHDVLSRLAAKYSYCRSRQGRAADAIRWGRTAVAEAEMGGGGQALARAYQVLNGGLMSRGDFSEMDSLRAAADICAELGLDSFRSYVLIQLGSCEYYTARWDEAAAHYREAFEALLRAGDDFQGWLAGTNIAEILCDQGRWDEAAELCRQALRVHRGSGGVYLTVLAMSQTATACARGGQLDQALRLQTEARDLARAHGLAPNAAQCEVRLAERNLLAGEHEAALALLDELAEQARQNHPAAAFNPQIRRLRAYALAQGGAIDEAFRWARGAVDASRRQGADYDLALGLEAIERLCRVTGQSPDPAESQERESIYARLGIVATPDLMPSDRTAALGS